MVRRVTRIAVCGGVYANPYALRAMLESARERGCERVVCLGDLGGFGPECNAVWPLLVEHGVECIAGNYDVAIGRGDEDCGCGYSDDRDNHYAQLMYDYTRANTSAAFAGWMRELPLALREDIDGVDVLCVHGSPLAINDFLWESLPDNELRMRLPDPAPDVLLCTHTGIPWQRRVDHTLIVNVGTIGRPANDGRREGWYAVLAVQDGRAAAELVPVAYDWQAHAASMRAAGLPEPFVETVETGWWTTCLEVVPPAERARGRYHVYRETLQTIGVKSFPAIPESGLVAKKDLTPAVGLFGTVAFPPRLWVYSNFHCNLACDYCVVASSPRARRRSLGLERFRSIVDEAACEGFAELYVTGGEPFVEPDIVAMLEYASDRLPTVVLTNAMLFRGRRRAELARLAGRANLVFQSSVDGARPETHDAWRGAGSWAKAMEGLAYARSLGLPMRVAMTETPENRDEVDELRALLASLDIVGDAFAVRPLVRRGFAAEVEGAMAVEEGVIVPELTVTADGIHWHPIGGDLDASPDMMVARAPITLAEGKRRIVQRFLELRLEDGSLPAPFQCAI
jgi:pyruvate-formate lyase-activating enzyme/predicted phosphodiesterase